MFGAKERIFEGEDFLIGFGSQWDNNRLGGCSLVDSS